MRTVPTLVANKRGIYEIRWSESRRSRRLSTRTTDLPAAQKALAGFLLEQHTSTSREAGMTLRQCAERYIADHPVIAEDVRKFALKYPLEVMGDLLVEEITPEVIANYKTGRLTGSIGKRAIKLSSLVQELRAVKTAMNHCVKHRLLPLESTPLIELPGRFPSKDVWLTREECRQFQAAADEVNHREVGLFVAIALATAARRSAILGLTWDRIALEQGLIDYRDGHDHGGKRRVPVPISASLKERLAEEIRERGEARGGLFRPGRWLFETQWANACRRAAQVTGSEKMGKVTPHTLRHTWATLAAQAGVPLFAIAGVLGDSVKTVTENYLHHCPDHLRAAVNFMDAGGYQKVAAPAVTEVIQAAAELPAAG